MKYEDMSREELIKEITACRKMLEEAEENIQQNDDYQGKYIELIRESLDGFAMLDKDGRFVFCNEEYCRITGYSAEELKNETYKDLTPSEYHRLDQENFSKMFTRGFSELYEKEYMRKDGGRIPIEIRSYLIKDGKGGFSGTWSYVRDISARKQAEEERREIDERFRIAQEMSPDGFTILRPVRDDRGRVVDFTWVYENEAVARMNGTDPQKVVGQRLLHLFPGHRGTQFFNSYKQVAETGKPITFEDKYVGETIKKETWFRIVVVPMGENIAILNQDITERKTAEENLLNTFNLSPSIIAKANLKTGLYVEANHAVTRVLGYSVEEFTSRPIREFIHPDDTEATEKAMSEQMEGKDVLIENRYLCKNGSYKWISWNANGANDEGIVLGIGTDITERKVLQERLTQAQKMESIGNLAGGIAHDFNNILSSVIGFTEIALDEAQEGSVVEDSLQEVYSAGKRARELVSQILAFARQSEEKRSPIQPSTVAKEVLSFIRSTIPTSIEIEQNIESESWIMGNVTQMHRVVMNLCTNSAHAMEELGGVLTVSMKDVFLNGKDVSIDLRSGDYIELKVSDTGVGISTEIVNTIFEPYFTTKRLGEGTGMGLAMVQGVVQSYGGKITVKSRVGKGTTFTIYLPITKKRSAGRAHAPVQLPTGKERILLIDDEPGIAKMGGQILERLGYQVTIRTSSVEAVELFESRPNVFDLVITDMSMPNMTGERVAMAMLKIRPDIPIILWTGYSKKITAETATQIGIKAFVGKPIVRAELAKTVRKVLDAANSENHQ